MRQWGVYVEEVAAAKYNLDGELTTWREGSTDPTKVFSFRCVTDICDIPLKYKNKAGEETGREGRPARAVGRDLPRDDGDEGRSLSSEMLLNQSTARRKTP